MHLVIDKAPLLRAMGSVARVVERRQTLEMLANVMISGTESCVQLTATDLDLELTRQISADTRATGAICVRAALLHDIIRRLPDSGQICLREKPAASQLEIECGRARFSLPSHPAAEFPRAPETSLPHEFALPQALAHRLFGKVQFAMSSEETRFYLNGVFLTCTSLEDGDALRAVTTDGHRLALSEIPAPPGAKGMPDIIIPRKCVGELMRALDPEIQTPLTLGVSSERIAITFDQTHLSSKLIDGTFPNYNQVIPTTHPNRVEFDRALFHEAVDRVATVASERTRGVKLSLATGKIQLQVSNPDRGFAEEEIDATYNGPPLEIGFNARYLLDLVSQLENETVALKLADNVSPVVVTETGPSNLTLVLMPLHI